MKALNLGRRPRLADMRRLESPLESARAAPPRRPIQILEAGPRITPAEDLADREGYKASFLGELRVELPTPLGSAGDDVLEIPDHDDRLDYTHFSVVMSRSRRMAMFVACNVDGEASVKVERDNDKWAYDGRIPIEAQIGEELYARNDLDRGHLVRREDPNWGELSEAETANADTFHFTNCSPQMAGFNQRTWLGLEDYVLQNARAWKDKVTVFTGPVFGEGDRIYRDVALPMAYWKVLAFVGDSGEPSATAYILDQKKQLRDLEAAYGRYKTYQCSVAKIEDLTGLKFGNLATYDGFTNEEAATGARIEAEIRTLADVRV